MISGTVKYFSAAAHQSWSTYKTFICSYIPLNCKSNNKQYVKYLKENPRIHVGDADVLALAAELDGIALLEDDEARGMAEIGIEGIDHHGTIYLLLRMMKMGLLTKDETLEKVDEMIHMGWRCSTELYAGILKAVRSSDFR